MPKLPENFAAEERVVHPYRPLVTVIAIIIVCSLIGGGIFYHYLQLSNAPDVFNWSGSSTVQPAPRIAATLTPEQRDQLFVANQPTASSRPLISTDDLRKLVRANSPR